MASLSSTPGLFLDRDGVLNSLIPLGFSHERPPWRVAELVISGEAVFALNQKKLKNFAQLVVTNQPDIARSKITTYNLEKINEQIRKNIPSIKAIYVCPHDNDDRCRCRKPLAGLLLQAANDWEINLEKSFTVGDRWVDIAAGKLAGTTTVLLESEYSWLPSGSGSPPKELQPDYVISSITELENLV